MAEEITPLPPLPDPPSPMPLVPVAPDQLPPSTGRHDRGQLRAFRLMVEDGYRFSREDRELARTKIMGLIAMDARKPARKRLLVQALRCMALLDALDLEVAQDADKAARLDAGEATDIIGVGQIIIRRPVRGGDA